MENEAWKEKDHDSELSAQNTTQSSSVYSPLKVTLDHIDGVTFALRAMRRPKKQIGEPKAGQDFRLAQKLILAGNDHAKFQRGVLAFITLEMQTGFMIEFETYRAGVECLSTSSSMHNELKKLTGVELAEQKQRDLVERIYVRDVVISYQALRSMYRARRNHRHPDWQIFCNFVETLPHFEWLIMPELEG